MMNYVATQLVAFYCVVWESPKGSGQIGVINPNTQIGLVSSIGSYKYLLKRPDRGRADGGDVHLPQLLQARL